jgi:hypothetical protein
MLQAHGRVPDDAILAVRRKVDCKLDKFSDAITAQFHTNPMEINTTIDDKLCSEWVHSTKKFNESILNEQAVLKTAVLKVRKSFSDDLASTARLLKSTVETLVTYLGKLSTLETTVNTLAMDLAAVKDVKTQVGNIADTIAWVEGDLAALRKLQATNLEAAVTNVKSQVDNLVDTVVRVDGNLAALCTLVTNAQSSPVGNSKSCGPTPCPSSTSNLCGLPSHPGGSRTLQDLYDEQCGVR